MVSLSKTSQNASSSVFVESKNPSQEMNKFSVVDRILIATGDHQNFCDLSSFGPKSVMSTSKRKHTTPPSSSPSSSKKRKHKHSTTSSKSSKVRSQSAPQLFQKSRLKIHVAVPPAATTSIDAYIQSHLTSTLLLKHTENGTIIALSGFKSLNGQGRIINENPFSWSWFEGDIVLFNPRIGQRIRTYPSTLPKTGY